MGRYRVTKRTLKKNNNKKKKYTHTYTKFIAFENDNAYYGNFTGILTMDANLARPKIFQGNDISIAVRLVRCVSQAASMKYIIDSDTPND